MSRWAKTLILAGVLAHLAAADAAAFVVYNRSSYTFRVRQIAGGDQSFDKTIAPGGDEPCPWTDSECSSQRKRTQDVRIEMTIGTSFSCRLTLAAGSYAVVYERARGTLPPDPYCLSVILNGSEANPRQIEPSFFRDPHQGDNVHFLATADPQFWWEGFWPFELRDPFADFTHFNDRNEAHARAHRVMTRLRSTVAASNRIRGILVAGDLTENARRDELSHYKASISGFERMVFDGLGNHDYEGEPVWEEKIQCNFNPTPPSLNPACRDAPGLRTWLAERARWTVPTKRSGVFYSWDWNEVHFVHANLFAGDEPPTEYDSTAQEHSPFGALAFLKSDLLENVGTSGRPVVIVQHYGFDDLSTSTDRPWWTEQQRVKLWNALAPYNVVAFFTGHVHQHALDQFEQPFLRPELAAGGPDSIPAYVAGGALKGAYLGVTMAAISPTSGRMTVERFDENGIRIRRVAKHYTRSGPRDLTPPTILLTGVTEGQVSIFFRPVFSATDANPGPALTARLERRATPQSSPEVIEPWRSDTHLAAPGFYTLRLAAVDLFGNQSERVTSFTVDVTAPVVQILGVPGPHVNVPVTPNVVVSDMTPVTVAVTVNGVPIPDPRTTPVTFSIEGSYLYSVVARDAALIQRTKSVSFTIDYTPPEVAIGGLPSADPSFVPVTPYFTVSDPNLVPSSVTARRNKLPFVSGATIAADGPHVLTVSAQDLAGNRGSASAEFEIFRVDASVSGGPRSGRALVLRACTTPDRNGICPLRGALGPGLARASLTAEVIPPGAPFQRALRSGLHDLFVLDETFPEGESATWELAESVRAGFPLLVLQGGGSDALGRLRKALGLVSILQAPPVSVAEARWRVLAAAYEGGAARVLVVDASPETIAEQGLTAFLSADLRWLAATPRAPRVPGDPVVLDREVGNRGRESTFEWELAYPPGSAVEPGPNAKDSGRAIFENMRLARNATNLLSATVWLPDSVAPLGSTGARAHALEETLRVSHKTRGFLEYRSEVLEVPFAGSRAELSAESLASLEPLEKFEQRDEVAGWLGEMGDGSKATLPEIEAGVQTLTEAVRLLATSEAKTGEARRRIGTQLVAWQRLWAALQPPPTTLATPPSPPGSTEGE